MSSNAYPPQTAPSPSLQKANEGSNTPEFSVSELSFALKSTVEDNFSHVRVRAELGRVVVAKSGHVYADLKDDKSVIAAIIWKGVNARLSTRPEEGMEVIVQGRLTTYPGRSQYQLIIEDLHPAGMGALMAMLEARKTKLKALGLFEEARKKPLPVLPKCIGVITSTNGVVIHDILHRIRARHPVPVIVWSVPVQGDEAAKAVCQAIKGFNAHAKAGTQISENLPSPDVLIIARGGGSVEDLWAFNDEDMVKAVANSHLPIISAIGHETDWTLIDYAADKRAPTPTGAAEMSVPVRADLLVGLAELGVRQARALTRLTSMADMRMRGARLPSLPKMLALLSQRLDTASLQLPKQLTRRIKHEAARVQTLSGRLRSELLIQNVHRQHEKVGRAYTTARQSVHAIVALKGKSLSGQADLLHAYSYENVLARGFALVHAYAQNDAHAYAQNRQQNTKLIRKKADIGAHKTLQIGFHDGTQIVHIDTNSKTLQKNIKNKITGTKITKDDKQDNLL